MAIMGINERWERMNNPRTILTAGPELDALVDERVMGQTLAMTPLGPIRKLTEGYRSFMRDESSADGLTAVPAYSRDIAAAWQVVLHMRTCGYDVDLDGYDASHVPTWECRMGGEHHGYREEWLACAESAQIAICLAAIKSVGDSRGEGKG